jgi:poly(hydroxyalkanoate) depolymerase family esterase
MKWSRELRIARRSVRTAFKAASSVAKARAKLPATLQMPSWSLPTPLVANEPPGEVAEFGSNPGKLSMFVHHPPRAPDLGAPLIVLLHGCGQTAAAFARDTGWGKLADQLGIPLVLPEQSGENNRGRCFNWFRSAHVNRDLGEALSIRHMVAAAIDRFGSDPARVFVAGLSAGGAMTAALMAAYPDVFAAGAIIAGLPVGAASTVSEALVRMAEAGPVRSRDDWARQVHLAAPTCYAGHWPRVSIWHGLADDVVDPTNARLLAEQWSAVHEFDSGTVRIEPDGSRCTTWGPPERPAVELWTLPDLPHAWPPGAVDRVARFWGLHPI